MWLNSPEPCFARIKRISQSFSSSCWKLQRYVNDFFTLPVGCAAGSLMLILEPPEQFPCRRFENLQMRTDEIHHVIIIFHHLHHHLFGTFHYVILTFSWLLQQIQHFHFYQLLHPSHSNFGIQWELWRDNWNSVNKKYNKCFSCKALLHTMPHVFPNMPKTQCNRVFDSYYLSAKTYSICFSSSWEIILKFSLRNIFKSKSGRLQDGGLLDGVEPVLFISTKQLLSVMMSHFSRVFLTSS